MPMRKLAIYEVGCRNILYLMFESSRNDMLFWNTRIKLQ